MNQIKYRYYKVAAVVLGQYGPVQYRVSVMTWGDLYDNTKLLTSDRLEKDPVGTMDRFVYRYSGPTFNVPHVMGSDGLRDRDDIRATRESVDNWFKKKARRFQHKLEEDIVWVQISLIPRLYQSENGSWNWNGDDSRFD
ncbi:MAG: hypothetical protein JWM46_399 [Candidatus Kaiserbacteria bacterium]|nr:hypothetical protein [Candidatus Kaiserbacteria bacterium]